MAATFKNNRRLAEKRANGKGRKGKNMNLEFDVKVTSEGSLFTAICEVSGDKYMLTDSIRKTKFDKKRYSIVYASGTARSYKHLGYLPEFRVMIFTILQTEINLEMAKARK